ncbi:MAG: Ada metal-binding domain-containing protein [Pseudohongiellaceae bacterium]
MRDPRFDGRFFVGVLTTGIYCRPICPVRVPKKENFRNTSARRLWQWPRPGGSISRKSLLMRPA